MTIHYSMLCIDRAWTAHLPVCISKGNDYDDHDRSSVVPFA